MVRTTLLNLMALCLISSTAPSSTAVTTAFNTADDFNLFSRATCSTSGYSPCNKANLPSNFCCPSSETCILFNDNKSVVCCPAGQDCKTFSPISCDITKQNATNSPESQLHSIDLTGSMAKCGSSCCPNGYSCQNNLCVMKASSTSKSSSTTSSSISGTTHTPTATTTKPPTSSTKTSASPKSTATSAEQNNGTAVTAHCNQFPASAVLVGFFPGVILGALLTIATICLFGRRKANSVKASNSSVFSSPAATVSDPIYQENNAYRSDFLRRGQQHNMDGAETAPRRTSKVRSLFSRSPPLTPPMRKEPSTESIKIYSPPNIAPNPAAEARQTTFSEMMHNAGFRAGEPYLGSPGRVDPRSRGVGS